jgi:hypothetical protein
MKAELIKCYICGEEFEATSHEEIATYICPCQRKVKNIDGALNKLSENKESMNKWDKEAFADYIAKHDQGILWYSSDDGEEINVAERAWKAALQYSRKRARHCVCGDVVGQCSCLDREIVGQEQRIKELEEKLALADKKLKSFDSYVCRDEKLVIAIEVLEMVEDHRKMPHQHEDLQTRLYCLTERAAEALKKIRGN